MPLGGLSDPLPFSIPVGPAFGGTGIASYTIGDLIYASGTTTLSKLADVAVGSVLASGGVGVAPSWASSIALTGTVASKQTANAGISLDHNSATGNFTHRLSPANLTANRRATFPDADFTVAGLSIAQTFTATQTISAAGGLVVSATTGTTLVVSSTNAAAISCSGGASFAGNTGNPIVIAAGGNARAASTYVNMNAAAGQTRAFTFQSGGAYRWLVSANSVAESGSNAGSNFAVNAYDDAGSFIDTPMTIARAAAGTITFTRPVTLSTAATSLQIQATTGTTLVVSSTNAAAISCSGGVSATLATLATGTITASTPAINATQTWNSGGVTFEGWKLNVTNTASSTASNLFDLQVGGVSAFSVNVGGRVVSISTTSSTSGIGATFETRRRSTGTPAAGFGSVWSMLLESSTTEDQGALEISTEWVDATHASRKARTKFNVSDTATRECLRLEAGGTAAMIGFLGAAAVVRATMAAATGTATRTTFDTATVTTAQLAERVKALIDDLRSYGLHG